MAECEAASQFLRFRNILPSVAEIEALEMLAVTQLPRWLRSARYAVERAQLPPDLKAEWPRPRTWFTFDYADGDSFDCSYPMLFRDEYYFLEQLNGMEEDDRRALRRFVEAFRGPYGEKKQAIERLLTDLRVVLDQPVPAPDEVNLLESYRALSKGHRETLGILAESEVMLSALYRPVRGMPDL